MTKQPHWSKAYLWDYLPHLLDGILVSRMAVSPRKVKTLRQDIRYSGTILGDSGALSYRAADQPPFSCQDLVEFYAQGQFNYGMTLDMVASPWVRPGGLPPDELERRLQLTLTNAETCLKLCDGPLGRSFGIIAISTPSTPRGRPGLGHRQLPTLCSGVSRDGV